MHLGEVYDESARDIATMLYGEMSPNGHFRFVNFWHPPPLVFSAEHRRFVGVDVTGWHNSQERIELEAVMTVCRRYQESCLQC